MSSSKSNLGHKRQLTHKQKRAMATRMVQPEVDDLIRSIFHSKNWFQRKWQIIQRVQRRQIRARYHSEVRKGIR